MHTRQHHELAFAHQQHAQMHRYHADAHHQQAMFHQQQATFHQNQLTNQGAYNEKTTAFNNQVSPAALIYQGHVSPQAMQSLNQFSNPYQQSNPNMPVSPRTAHTTDNQNAWNRGTQF
ncbi:hypothetical protein [Brevibacillus choshinensis]|uniref:Spore coat protein n=1 Tax=Brevibacillus choshinensis TaxID=54911 RepID=A0ABX7FP12_BRECH|nr:hypothetical protein [Brevibacillus choshinensis]QRG67042.1 hypothetical protein JNE38_26830 [Brevibacillus choshinensis]